MTQHKLNIGDPWPKLLFLEEAQVFLPIGWVGGKESVSGLKSLFVQPYVPDVRYGGGVRLIRDWDSTLGARPKMISLAVKGTPRVVLLHLGSDISVEDLKGSGEGKATIGLKGLRGKTLKCDDWERVVGTYDDIDFEEWDFGKDPEASGFQSVQLNENTSKDGKPLLTSKWKTLHDPKPRKGNGGRLGKESIGRLVLTKAGMGGK